MPNFYWTIFSFFIYLSMIIGIGIYANRYSSKGIAEYFVGGRKLNRFVVALSAVVSGRSAWLLIGMTGMAYSQGASAVWAVVGYILVELILFLGYAKRLRSFANHHDTITLPDFFASRFGDARHTLRITVVVIIFVFMAAYVSAQFVAGGKAFATSFDISSSTGLILTAAIVLSYTMVGGFLAVSLTDMVQAILMLLALVILPIVIVNDLGGWSETVNALYLQDALLVDPFSITAGAAIGLLAIGLGSPGNPHIITRYLSIEHPSQLNTAAWVGTLWNILMASEAIMIGLVGRVWAPEISQLPDADTENLYTALASSYLHPAIYGLVLAAIFAAIMSTADSQLLVGASAIVRDLYEKIWKEGSRVEQSKLVKLSRVVVAVLVMLAVALAFVAEDLVFWLVLFAWAGLGAVLGPTTILALYWKGTTRIGVIVGMITATLTTIIWYLIPSLKAITYELIPGFLVGLIVTWMVSLATKMPDNAEEMMHQMK